MKITLLALFTFAVLLATAVVSPAFAADGENVAQLQTTTPPKAPTWKATESSVLFDLSGTQIANNNLYAFGHVRVLAENLSLEKTFSPEWKGFVRAQYSSNFYELIAGGKIYEERTSGLGDTVVGAAHPLYVDGGFRLLADAGVTLPTGSIDYGNEYAPGHRYKYFLQMGSGTFDGAVGATALYIQPAYQVLGRVSSILRNQLNNNGYRLGNVYRADASLDVPVGLGFTSRLVGGYRQKAAIEGGDPTLGRTASTEFYYHDQIDWSVNAALKFEHAIMNQVSVNAELGAPLLQGMQNYDSVVISTNYYGSVALAGQF